MTRADIEQRLAAHQAAFAPAERRRNRGTTCPRRHSREPRPRAHHGASRNPRRLQVLVWRVPRFQPDVGFRHHRPTARGDLLDIRRHGCRPIFRRCETRYAREHAGGGGIRVRRRRHPVRASHLRFLRAARVDRCTEDQASRLSAGTFGRLRARDTSLAIAGSIGHNSRTKSPSTTASGTPSR